MPVTSTEIAHQLNYVWCGLQDAFKWNIVVSTILNDEELRRNVLKSIALNSLSLVLIYIFDFFLLPSVQYRWDLAHGNTNWLYQAIWLFPVMAVSLYLNSVWCSTIAQRTYLLKHGTNASALLHHSTGSSIGILNVLFNSSHRAIMISICLASSFVLSHVPYLGSPMSFTYLCWIDAYYCFEFVWVAKGMSLAKRTRHVEERWAYFLAFGLPVTALCSWGTSLTSATSFALVFPAYIILAMHADPVPLDPHSPASPHHEDSRGVTKTSSLAIRLPIFAPIIWLNDKVTQTLIGRLDDMRSDYHSTGYLSGSTWREPYVADTEIIVEEGTHPGAGSPVFRSPLNWRDTDTIANRRKLD
ncbi:hypothetical protein M378DRAFT_71289 [Amanita muscaria Koide BX008]|uniref:Uncharacterized protein n=1 Tax=Amanita muscaria (strain Koide BX008) TaxID=946122 RepID=A0A0C2XGM6_AMAMK|nr:hypothetical protein M378DRAFT_71289 [Amanita muscaria Koide BX008]